MGYATTARRQWRSSERRHPPHRTLRGGVLTACSGARGWSPLGYCCSISLNYSPTTAPRHWVVLMGRKSARARSLSKSADFSRLSQNGHRCDVCAAALADYFRGWMALT